MASKYVDTTAIMQVIGCVYNNPKLLEFTDKYTVVDEDFADTFHKTVFGAIYKLHELALLRYLSKLFRIFYRNVLRVRLCMRRIKVRNGYSKFRMPQCLQHLITIIKDLKSSHY